MAFNKQFDGLKGIYAKNYKNLIKKSFQTSKFLIYDRILTRILIYFDRKYFRLK